MTTVVLVPRRGGGWRDRVWAHVQPEIEALGYPVYIADSDTEIFAITQAWNNAARAAGGWTKAILHLADHYVTPESVHAAVAADHPGIVWCFDRVIRLNQAGNEAFFDGRRGAWQRSHLRRRQLPYPLRFPYNTYEGPRVVNRDLWEKVGGFDERSYGWGAEDQLFTDICNRVHPDRRMRGVLVDFWHEKQGNLPDDPYYGNREANRALLREVRGG